MNTKEKMEELRGLLDKVTSITEELMEERIKVIFEVSSDKKQVTVPATTAFQITVEGEIKTSI